MKHWDAWPQVLGGLVLANGNGRDSSLAPWMHPAHAPILRGGGVLSLLPGFSGLFQAFRMRYNLASAEAEGGLHEGNGIL